MIMSYGIFKERNSFNSVVRTYLVLNFFISMRITYLCKLNRQIVVFAFEKEVVISFVWSVVLVR